MQTQPSLPELVATAQATAKPIEDRIAEIRASATGQTKDLRAATGALELAAVDIFSVFEARMQHHFRRGPFSRKLQTLLLETDNTDLANRLHHYYLAVNVLKHGKGASHRELLATPSHLFHVNSGDETDPEKSLVDITTPGFFDGLTTTILEATDFLENRPTT